MRSHVDCRRDTRIRPPSRMIRAAIIGLGRWGRSLVASVQGKSDGHRFRRRPYPHARQRRGFLPRAGHCLWPTATSAFSPIPGVDAVVLATPHSVHEQQILAAAAAGKHIHVREADHARPRRARTGGRRRAQGRRGAGGRLLPALSSLARGDTAADRRRAARHHHLHGGAAHHQHRAVHPARQLARRRPGSAGRRAHRGRRAFTRSHDRVRRPRARRAAAQPARYFPGASDDTTTVMLRFESGASGLLFCSVATATNFSFTLYGSRGLAEISKPDLRSFRFVPISQQPPTGPITAPPDEIAEHAGFDMLKAELTAFARSIREQRPYPVPIDEVLHGMSVFDAIVRSARTGTIEAVMILCPEPEVRAQDAPGLISELRRSKEGTRCMGHARFASTGECHRIRGHRERPWKS